VLCQEIDVRNSSRLMIAPTACLHKFSGGVSLEVNMICSPVRPTRSGHDELGHGAASAPTPDS